MFLARVVGELVADIRHPALHAYKLLWVEPTDATGRRAGARRMAIDKVDAGPGDWVLVLDEGNSAAQVLGRPRGPIRTVVVGVVDEVTCGGGLTTQQ